MSKSLSGRAFIRVNGVTLISLPGAKMSPGGFERTPVVADVGYVGFTEKPLHAEIECEIVVDADTDILALAEATNATVTFETSNGRVWLMRGGALASPPAYEGSESKASLKYIGHAVENA